MHFARPSDKRRPTHEGSAEAEAERLRKTREKRAERRRKKHHYWDDETYLRDKKTR